MMNGAGHWRYSLGWTAIHTAMMISLIIHDRLIQGMGEKRTSTFSSRCIVFDSHVCGNIFENCLPILMMRPPDGIIFTIMKFN
jgi:hypothetical protein